MALVPSRECQIGGAKHWYSCLLRSTFSQERAQAFYLISAEIPLRLSQSANPTKLH